MTGLRLAVLLVLVPAVASAQIRITRNLGGSNAATALLDRNPADFGVTGWRVGQWARYSISQNIGAPMPLSSFRTVSIVGARGSQFWVEAQEEFQGMGAGAVAAGGPVRKTLIPFGGSDERPGTESYLLAPDSSVRRSTLVRAASGQRPETGFPQGWSRAGEESVTTPGGTFRAVHWRKGGDELWTSGDAGPVGVVRFRSADFEVELVARGDTGARSKVPFGGSN